MNDSTPFLPVIASRDLDIYNADRRATVPAVAGIAATTPALNPRALDVLDQIENAKRNVPAKVGAFLDHLGSLISEHRDADAVLDFALNALAKAPTECPVHSWCKETGDHHDHSGRTTWAACEDAYGNPVLSAGLIDWGQGVKVGLLDLDLTPGEARGKLAELRTHLDRIEQLISLAEQGATNSATGAEAGR
ncbi:hypothetical protein ACFYNM_22970 [Streptomyces spororaveus]|uniref:hypothetical protein n=1 Tax=Streptomyces spororaveus TaxID=284039 RepID=UPI003692B3A3